MRTTVEPGDQSVVPAILSAVLHRIIRLFYSLRQRFRILRKQRNGQVALSSGFD